MSDSIPLQKAKVFRVKVDLDTGSLFEELCKNERTNINAKLKGLIDASIKGQKRYFLAGRNEINYNKLKNTFTWSVQLDTGQERKVLEGLSADFLGNLMREIEAAIRERNEWIHQTKADAVAIPKVLTGEDNG